MKIPKIDSSKNSKLEALSPSLKIYNNLQIYQWAAYLPVPGTVDLVKTKGYFLPSPFYYA